VAIDFDAAPYDPARLRIVAYSDYVCPWCYIGLHRIDRLQREFPVDVEWRPFELHPETPTTGADLRGRLGDRERVRAYTQNIINLARESGIDMRMPVVVANSHRALEAAECAREGGGAESVEAYHRALFHASFVEARDIGDIDVLCDIARASGVDDQRLRQALADETYRQRIDDITNAARADEILSTPTFIYEGGFRLTGAQDYAVFESVTRRLLARRAAPGGT
jgi:predicted DsbA family dithiol-disulfide isomerase